MATCPRCGHSATDLEPGAPCPTEPEIRLVDDQVLESHRDAMLGRVVGHRFALVGVAGEGGIGKVYEAIDEHALDRRRVAVKVLKRSHVDDDTVRGRFFREAEIMESLRHPNLVEMVDAGELEDDSQRLYIAMEFVEGHGLDDLQGTQTIADGAAVVGIALGVAHALAAAHDAGVVHRDLKPSNVLIVDGAREEGTPAGSDTRVRVVDFGIARAQPTKSTLTKTGMLFGTPAYMSPEQALGETDIGPQTDVYAFGVMLYEMIAGKRPFAGEQALVLLMAHANQPPPPLEPRCGMDVPAPLTELAERCLAKDPEDRPTDGNALVNTLEAIASKLGRTRVAAAMSVLTADAAASATDTGPGALPDEAHDTEPTGAAPVPTPETTFVAGDSPAALRPESRMSRRTVTIAVAIVVVLAIGGTLGAVMLSSDDDANAAPAELDRGDDAASVDGDEPGHDQTDDETRAGASSPGSEHTEPRRRDDSRTSAQPAADDSATPAETGTSDGAASDRDEAMPDTSIPDVDDERRTASDDEMPNTSIPDVEDEDDEDEDDEDEDDDRADDEDRRDDDADRDEDARERARERRERNRERAKKAEERRREREKREREREREKRKREKEAEKELRKAGKKVQKRLEDEIGKRVKWK